jgi:hypothetical protein
MLAIDAANTFSAALLMGSAPKAKYGSKTGEISVNADGVPQYQVSVAVTYLPNGAGRVISEVIPVTIAAHQDPAKDIAAGTPVQLDGLRAGVSDPEVRDDGKGVRGGKIWYTATAVRPAVFRQAKDAAA